MVWIRIIAIAALVLSAGLAGAFWIPQDVAYADRAGQLALLFVAAGNAGGVAWPARFRRDRLAIAGFCLVLTGVVAASALATAEYWFNLVLQPDDGSLMGMLERAGEAFILAELLLWTALAAFVLGWGCWSLSLLLARRRARVASARLLPPSPRP